METIPGWEPGECSTGHGGLHGLHLWDPLCTYLQGQDNSGIYRRRGAGTGLGSILWFAIMGSLGLHLGMDGTLSVAQLADIASKPETGLFIVMGQYPLGMILCVVSLILLCTFFITSANSGTFVLAMFSSRRI